MKDQGSARLEVAADIAVSGAVAAQRIPAIELSDIELSNGGFVINGVSAAAARKKKETNLPLTPA